MNDALPISVHPLIAETKGMLCFLVEYVGRERLQTRVKHLNPLFMEDIGVTSESIVPDSLHCFWLGPAKGFCRDMIWNIVLANVGGFVGTQDDKHACSCALIRSDLMSWYAKEHIGGRDYSQLQDFRLEMIGKKTNVV